MTNPITQALLKFSQDLIAAGAIAEPVEISLPRETFHAFRTELLETGEKWKSYEWPQSDHVILKGDIVVHVRIKR